MNTLKWWVMSAVMMMAGAGQAQTPPQTPPAPDTDSHVVPAHREVRSIGGHGHSLHVLLHRLNLTDTQKVQVKALLEQVRKQHESLLKGERDNGLKLLSVDPAGPDYAALLATQKANVTALIQLRSDTWVRLYAMLTPEQQVTLPDLVRELQNRSWPPSKRTQMN